MNLHPLPSRCVRPILLGLAIVALAATSVTLAGEPTAVAFQDRLSPTGSLPVVRLPQVDLAAVAAEDAQRELQGLAPRFAIPNDVLIRPDTDGLWETVDDTLVWRLRVASPGATSLNLGFTRYHMPEGGRLYVYSADLARRIRPFTAEDNAEHGQLWTPILRGDELVVEVTLPAAVADELELKLGAINVGYRGFEDVAQPLSGSCNNDVVCPEGDPWRDEIPAIAAISTGGSLFCSGFMVNNTANDETPYFMTAYHCGIYSGNAASLVVYWNYETTVCGGFPNGTLTDFQSGSFFRSRYSPSDFTLVELDSDPDPAWGITFAGWDRSGNAPTSAVCIHHPNVDEKAISFENDPTSTTSYLSNSVPGDGTHIRITDWDDGTTEPGSSGSPLFGPNHKVVGQLHGGYASCTSQTSDWFGKFSVSWNGGGSPATRLSDWLDTAGTGAVTVDTLVPGSCSGAGDCDDGVFCNGAESCVGGTCKAGGNPCPGQECDEVTDTCVPLACNNDGTCDSGEDCTTCANDCISGGAAGCGNGICEPSLGEDCLSCGQDCAGKQNGNPSRRYCCGDGDGDSPVGCNDARCSSGGWECSDTPSAGYCCGDGSCDPGEDVCSCALDCGSPASEICDDGTDNDCDGDVDCADADCGGDPACSSSCVQPGGMCTSNGDCCSQRCKGNHTCK